MDYGDPGTGVAVGKLADYARYKDVAMAGKELTKALGLAPRSKWACYHLAEIYRQDGYAAKAVINDIDHVRP